MIALGTLALLRPAWLLALPLVAVLAAYAGLKVAGLADWTKAIDPPLLDAMRRARRVRPGASRSNLPLIATALLLALALVGPAVERAVDASFRNLDGTVLVVDLSQSVARSERFDAARAAAQEALAAAGSRQVALVVFAGDAFLGSPFTADHAALRETIFGLDAQTVPVPGSRPGAALELAQAVLKQAGIVSGDVAFISDGVNVDAGTLRLAKALGDAGFRIDTLYVEPAAGRPGNAGGLRALAAATGGASANAEAPEAVVAALADRPADRLAAGGLAGLAFTDLGPLLVALALVPALLLFRRSV